MCGHLFDVKFYTFTLLKMPKAMTTAIVPFSMQQFTLIFLRTHLAENAIKPKILKVFIRRQSGRWLKYLSKTSYTEKVLFVVY
jgi:hypothetical protein